MNDICLSHKMEICRVSKEDLGSVGQLDHQGRGEFRVKLALPADRVNADVTSVVLRHSCEICKVFHNDSPSNSRSRRLQSGFIKKFKFSDKIRKSPGKTQLTYMWFVIGKSRRYSSYKMSNYWAVCIAGMCYVGISAGVIKPSQLSASSVHSSCPFKGVILNSGGSWCAATREIPTILFSWESYVFIHYSLASQ